LTERRGESAAVSLGEKEEKPTSALTKKKRKNNDHPKKGVHQRP